MYGPKPVIILEFVHYFKRKEMIDLANLIDEVRDRREILTEGGAGGHLKHLYEDGKLTFGEMKQIFNDVF